MTTNNRIRFMNNNRLTGPAVPTFSSAKSGFPGSNATNTDLNSQWVFDGNFVITSSNNTFYGNDSGGDFQFTIADGEYTAAGLVSALQTGVDSVTSGWTVAYNSLSGDYRFVFSKGASFTIRGSVSTNAIWDTIGFVSGTNISLSSGSIFAEEQRNHSYEYIKISFAYQHSCEFVGVIGKFNEIFNFSLSAEIRLQANNIDDFTSPPLDVLLTPTSRGILSFIPDDVNGEYRFWRIKFIDRTNPLGPNLAVSHIYFGPYVTFTQGNLQKGFSTTLSSNNIVSTSVNGALFIDQSNKFNVYSNMSLGFIEGIEKETFEQFVYDHSTSVPFFVSFDPNLVCSDDVDQYTRFVIFDVDPVFQHIKHRTFLFNFNLREFF